MNSFSNVRAADDSSDRRPYFQAAMHDLKAAPHFSELQAPVGGLAIWGGNLGWPDWLVEGTSMDKGMALPAWISIGDEMLMHANLLDRLGEKTVMRSYLFDPYPPFDGSSLASIQAAPDLRSLLHAICNLSNQENPHISCGFAGDGSGCSVTICVAAEFSSIGPLLERFILAALLRMVMLSMSHIGVSGCGTMRPISVGMRGCNLDVANLIYGFCEAQVDTDARKTMLTVDTCLADFPNRNSKPAKWQSVLQKIANSRTIRQDAFCEVALRDRIQASLNTAYRVPRLNELANAEGVSERTMSRQLAQRGLRFDQIVTEVRMELARELVEDSDEKLASVAHLLGYSSNASFSRAFRQEFGEPPARWRELRKGLMSAD